MPSETYIFILIQTAFRSDIGRTGANLRHAAFDMPSEGKDDKLPPSVFRRHIVFK
ncbi:hypothetical protein LMH45_09300 [Neisseria gonorrhoeae]|uniref:hypothetical protein n=1 Tax=Neisseria gonorrhoeae TaxID=485 RepID=UPI001E2C6AC3|nr:hypothetical protein [Neisseria gonorrhoeae]MCC9032313.1 hypothetical protein [Neisseria gonorrhoeae]UWT46106.1 hypothetical protein NDQ67_02680 [Neisseria gonorrhoeae]